MAVHGIVRPGIPGRHSLALLVRFVDAFRLRAYRSLLRLVAPVASTRRRRYPATSLLATRTHIPPKALGKNLPLTNAAVVESTTGTGKKLQEVGRILDGNVVPYRGRRLPEEFTPERHLERLCIAPESFGFGDLRRGIASDGDVMVSGEIDGKVLRSGSGLCLEEVGRQLGQLALVAVSACDVRRHDTFYVATSASMEDCHTDSVIRQSKLTGLVRIVRLQAHDAQAEVTLWAKDCLVCRMSVQYDVFSSWQEVLPSLANSSVTQ